MPASLSPPAVFVSVEGFHRSRARGAARARAWKRPWTVLTGGERETLGMLHGSTVKVLSPLLRYVHQNALCTLRDLPALPALSTLNVSSNCLPTLDGIERLPHLQTLCAARNELRSVEACRALIACTSLESLDLSENGLGGEGLLDFLATAAPRLRCLYLAGTPLATKTVCYRKRVIARLPHLTFLDDRPVTSGERRCAEAWEAGGTAAEVEARRACAAEQRAEVQADVEALISQRPAQPLMQVTPSLERRLVEEENGEGVLRPAAILSWHSPRPTNGVCTLSFEFMLGVTEMLGGTRLHPSLALFSPCMLPQRAWSRCSRFQRRCRRHPPAPAARRKRATTMWVQRRALRSERATRPTRSCWWRERCSMSMSVTRPEVWTFRRSHRKVMRPSGFLVPPLVVRIAQGNKSSPRDARLHQHTCPTPPEG